MAAAAKKCKQSPGCARSAWCRTARKAEASPGIHGAFARDSTATGSVTVKDMEEQIEQARQVHRRERPKCVETVVATVLDETTWSGTRNSRPKVATKSKRPADQQAVRGRRQDVRDACGNIKLRPKPVRPLLQPPPSPTPPSHAETIRREHVCVPPQFWSSARPRRAEAEQLVRVGITARLHQGR